MQICFAPALIVVLCCAHSHAHALQSLAKYLLAYVHSDWKCAHHEFFMSGLKGARYSVICV